MAERLNEFDYQIGDRVVWTGGAKHGDACNLHWVGHLGVISGVRDRLLGRPPRGDTIFNITWTGEPPRGDGLNRDIYARWVELAAPDFDPALPVRIRDGRPLDRFVKTGDKERPFGAYIELDGEVRLVTYNKHGLFYKNFELPYDLVNPPASSKTPIPPAP